MLMAILLIVMVAQWILTLFFYKQLPGAIPITFPEKGYPEFAPRIVFLLFPALCTIGGVLVLILSRFKILISFPGKGMLKSLPAEIIEAIHERAYQVILMIVIIATMITGYFQANLALYSTGRINGINMTTLYGVLLILVLYILLNVYLLYKLARDSVEVYKQQAEIEGQEVKEE
jgi:hypothetical protein